MNLHIGGSGGDFTCQRTVKVKIHTRTATLKITSSAADCLLPQKGAGERQTGLSRWHSITHELQRGVLCFTLVNCITVCISLVYRPVTSEVQTVQERAGECQVRGGTAHTDQRQRQQRDLQENPPGLGAES